MSDHENQLCTRCGNPFEDRGGDHEEPGLCDPCAQAMVVELQAKLAAAEKERDEAKRDYDQRGEWLSSEAQARKQAQDDLATADDRVAELERSDTEKASHALALLGRAEAAESKVSELELDAQLAKAEADVQIYVPGSWECPKCNFQLTKSYLHPNGISPNLEAAESCPNDGEVMRRCTWKKDAIALSDRLSVEIPKLRDAESALSAATAAREKDKERLDWLDGQRQVFESTPESNGWTQWEIVTGLQGPDKVRAAIDAARAGGGA